MDGRMDRPRASLAKGHDANRSRLQVTTTLLDGAIVVRPEGELNLGTAPLLRDVLLKHAADEPRAVIVDLAQLTVSRSCLLSVLNVVWRRIPPTSAVRLIVVGDHADLAFTVVPATVPVYPSVNSAIADIDEPPRRLLAKRTFAASLRSLAVARRYVTETLAAWPVTIDGATVDDAVLIVNELIENVILHTPVAEARIRLEWRSPWLHLAVADDDPTPAVLHEHPPEHVGGLGLVLVSRLSHTWGSSRQAGGGKVVWAILPAGQR